MYTSRPVGEMVRIGLSLKLSDLPSTDLGVDQVAGSEQAEQALGPP